MLGVMSSNWPMRQIGRHGFYFGSEYQVGLKRENEYIPIFEYLLSFKDSSS